MRKNLLALIVCLSSFETVAVAQPTSRRCGDIEFSVRKVPTSEDNVEELSLIGNGKRLLAPRMLIPGRVIPLCRSGRILLLDDSSLHSAGPSFVIDTEGEVRAAFDFGDVAAFYIDPDERFFWVQSFVYSPPAQPVSDFGENYVTRLWFVSGVGDILEQEDFREKAVKRIQFDGLSVSVSVLEPDLPN